MKKTLFLLLALSLSLTGCKKDQKEPAKAPSVATGSVSAVTTTSFDCEGSVSADGGATVTDKGICYAITSAPTISNSKVSGGAGMGSFKVSVSGLQSGKVYYARAYATNSASTAYGQEVTVALQKVVEGISLSPTEKSLIEGEKFTIKVTFSPNDVPNKAVNWRSDKSDIASVDNNGVVTAHKEGVALITATAVDGGKSASCRVTVNRKVIKVTGITISPTEKSVIEGESFIITPTVLPADADNKEVTWSSSAADVASVDNQGKVSTHKPGNATITATTVDGGKEATCKVTVKSKITEEYKALKEKAEKIEEKIDAAEDELDEIKKENKTVNEKRNLMEALLRKIEAIKDEINSLNDEIDEKKDLLYKNELDELKEKVKTLTSERNKLQKDANDYKLKLDKAAKEGKGNISDLDIVDL